MYEEARPALLRILIVDDCGATRQAIRSILSIHHWSICGEAHDGWSGIKKFNELKPDLVVLDLRMPDINGIEAGRWMSDADPTVPIILFTVADGPELEAVAREAGICAVVPKGEAAELIRTIETAISQTPQPD
jgi:two-component system, chemotaxis family, chemotaxis protein CheY